MEINKLNKNKIEYKIENNVSIERMRQVWNKFNAIDHLVGRELNFTVAPSRCSDIQYIKKRIMSLVTGRIKMSKPVAFIMTRENHKSGWPHIHAVGWWDSDRDNSETLGDGRVYVVQKDENKKFATGRYMFNELGKVKIYSDLRVEPYIQESTGEAYEDWLDYMCKDQNVNWREKNCIGFGELDVSKFFSKDKIDTFVD